jgi:EpsI family protein
MGEPMRWVPAGLLSVGCLLNFAVVPNRVRPMPLAAPVTALPAEVEGLAPIERRVSPEEEAVAGMDSYVLREYRRADSTIAFSTYVGYYEEQAQGNTIHSPRNCLPGAGWEPVSQGPVEIATASGRVVVNRYQLVKGESSALVYYWYQGRGRVAHNEFRVKLELLRDAALHGRTEEALVRVVVPFRSSDLAAADSVAQRVAGPLADQVAALLPPAP